MLLLFATTAFSSPSAQAPIILGGLGGAEIDAVVAPRRPDFQACYAKALEARPGLAGEVVVKFVVAADGKVSSAVVKASTLDHPDAESCITGHFVRMEFPAPRGGGIVIVSYPLAFGPG